MIVSVKKLLSTIAILSVFSPVFAVEESNFSYDYMEVGYSYWGMDGSTSDRHYDGYKVKASKSITENIYLSAGYLNVSRETSSSTTELDEKFLGGGVHYPLSGDTDIILDFSHIKTTGKYEYSDGSYSDSIEDCINFASIGMRHQLFDDLEMTAAIERLDWAGKDILYSGVRVGAIQEITKDLSLGFSIAELKDSASNTVDWTDILLGIRYYY